MKKKILCIFTIILTILAGCAKEEKSNIEVSDDEVGIEIMEGMNYLVAGNDYGFYFDVYSKSGDKKNNDSKIYLEYIDKEAWEKQISPAVGDIKGNYPDKENEIMLSQSVIDLLKLKDIKPGDKVIFNCNINKKTESIEFVVSGTYTDYSMEKRNDIDKLSYVSNEFVKKHNLSLEKNGILTIDIKDSKKENAENILKSGVDLNKNQSFVTLYEQSNFEENAKITSLAIVVIVSFFMILSGYLLIYNILYIAITKDIQFYGMLKTIGASPKQIKKIVKGQGLRLH